MHPGVTPIIKERVIEDWFQGLTRDYIANKHGIGTGTVTRIIREWVAGFEDKGMAGIVDSLRYFAVTFRKLKLTIPDCVLGARNVAMMNNLGIERNDFEQFISETYKFLRELGVDPKKTANCIKQMEDLTRTMTIAQIPQYISELAEKKKQLSKDIERLEVDELDTKVKVQLLNKKAKDLGEEYQQFAEIKLELKKYGLEIGDLESFAQTVKQAHELGFDAHLIGSNLAQWDELKKEKTDLALDVLKLKGDKENLEHKKDPYRAMSNYLESVDYSTSET